MVCLGSVGSLWPSAPWGGPGREPPAPPRRPDTWPHGGKACISLSPLDLAPRTLTRTQEIFNNF